jgi:hypothetical protein
MRTFFFLHYLKRNIVYVLLGLVLITGSFLRIHNLGEPSLWIDEGYSINGAQAVTEHNYPLLPSGDVYTNQILASYLIAGTTALFDFDPFIPWSARAPSVFFGIAIILAVFLFTRRITNNNWLALGAAIIVAFLPWEIAWSRQARGYMMLSFFLVTAFDQLIAFFQDIKISSLVYFCISFGLAILSHSLAIVFLPGILLTGLFWFYQKKQSRLIRSYIFFSIILIGIVYIGIKKIPNLEIFNFFSFYNDFIIAEYTIFIILGIIGFLFLYFKKKDFLPGLLLLGGCAFAYIIIAGYGHVIQFRYLVPLLPFLAIGFAVVFYESILYILRAFISKKSEIFYGIISILLVIFLFTVNIITFQSTSRLDTGSPQPDFGAAYQYIRDNRTSDDIIISTYAHLSKIYLSDPGILLPISLTGRKSQIPVTAENRDWYTNTSTIGLSDLKQFGSLHNGYIIFDNMALNRLPSLLKNLKDQGSQLVYLSLEESSPPIWVFKY